jgi:hypothetical protein
MPSEYGCMCFAKNREEVIVWVYEEIFRRKGVFTLTRTALVIIAETSICVIYDATSRFDPKARRIPVANSVDKRKSIIKTIH